MDIPLTTGKQKRVVIVGAGFAGLKLARMLPAQHFQVVLLDRNNYHQFQPLLYQVATAGLEPSSISFPLRKIFQKSSNVFLRVAEAREVLSDTREIDTCIGRISYDYLVLAHGAETNFFGNSNLQHHGYPMKSVSDALLIRNTLLQNYEHALTTKNEGERNALLNVVIVGGGPTGVELAGAVAEMKNKLLPKDYPEIDFGSMKIYLLEAGRKLLGGLSNTSSDKVRKYLEELGVEVKTDTAVKDYDGQAVSLENGVTIQSRCLIWAAGVKGVAMSGIPKQSILPNNRILVDDYNRVRDMEGVFAIGDIAAMAAMEYQKGHPQVAPVAIQQATLLARNLRNCVLNKPLRPFIYEDKGSMATVGRNLAVAEMGRIRLSGFIAWVAWMLVHLMSVIGLKNRVFILINWMWQYATYDQSLRLIIKPAQKAPAQQKKSNQPEKLVGSEMRESHCYISGLS